MRSVWRCKFESVEKCESGCSKIQYVCDTIYNVTTLLLQDDR